MSTFFIHTNSIKKSDTYSFLQILDAHKNLVNEYKFRVNVLLRKIEVDNVKYEYPNMAFLRDLISNYDTIPVILDLLHTGESFYFLSMEKKNEKQFESAINKFNEKMDIRKNHYGVLSASESEAFYNQKHFSKNFK